jgi:hypothetical protein
MAHKQPHREASTDVSQAEANEHAVALGLSIGILVLGGGIVALAGLVRAGLFSMAPPAVDTLPASGLPAWLTVALTGGALMFMGVMFYIHEWSRFPR